MHQKRPVRIACVKNLRIQTSPSSASFFFVRVTTNVEARHKQAGLIYRFSLLIQPKFLIKYPIGILLNGKIDGAKNIFWMLLCKGRS